MTCDFMSFSTVFQLYQDDGQMKMQGCATEPRLRLRISPRVGLEFGTAR